MKMKKYYLWSLLTASLLLFGAPASWGAVSFQCPGFDPAVDSDLDGDGMLRAVDGEISAPKSASQVCMHLTGGDGFIRMADDSEMYIFGFANLTGVPDADVLSTGLLAHTFPAPLIVVDEGDEVYLSLTNIGLAIRPDLFDAHTVHWHGFPHASAVFDGLPDSAIAINMGSTLTYYYNVVEPGTFMYHCHVEATEHMQMGMLGNLYVRPAQNKTGYGGNPATISQLGGNPDPAAPMGYTYNDGDGSTAYDVEYALQLGAFDPAFHEANETVQPLPFADMFDKYPMINGRGYPDTASLAPPPAPTKNGGIESQPQHSLVTAVAGQKILLRLSNLDVTRFYTLASMIPMTVVGKDARHLRGPSGLNLYYTTNSLNMGGGESFDALLDTTGLTAGRYFIYTTNMNYLSNNAEDFGGMMTEIVITN